MDVGYQKSVAWDKKSSAPTPDKTGLETVNKSEGKKAA